MCCVDGRLSHWLLQWLLGGCCVFLLLGLPTCWRPRCGCSPWCSGTCCHSVSVCLSVCVMARLTDCQYVLLCVYLMSRIADALTAEARMLAVVEWYLLSFHAGRQVCVCCCMLWCHVALPCCSRIPVQGHFSNQSRWWNTALTSRPLSYRRSPDVAWLTKF